MRIFLIGFMGSGKTTLGSRLAKKLEYDFLDTDQYIESQSGLSIPEIFALQGESAFREWETRALSHALERTRVVVSTGGGLPCHSGHMEIMSENGVVVYLKMSVQSLVSRLESAQKKRPLIEGLGGDGLREFVSQRLQTREIYYNQAHCIIKGESAKPASIISLVFG